MSHQTTTSEMRVMIAEEICDKPEPLMRYGFPNWTNPMVPYAMIGLARLTDPQLRQCWSIANKRSIKGNTFIRNGFTAYLLAQDLGGSIENWRARGYKVSYPSG